MLLTVDIWFFVALAFASLSVFLVGVLYGKWSKADPVVNYLLRNKNDNPADRHQD